MTTVTGSCHCGAVGFEMAFGGPIETSRCSCSICRKARFWKTVVPADAFTLLCGENALRSYRFGSGSIDHRFCAGCGVKLFGTVQLEGTAFVAVSALPRPRPRDSGRPDHAP